MTLPKHQRSGVTPKYCCRAGEGQTKPGDHLVEDKERTDPVTFRSKTLEKTVRRGHEIHVGGDRFHEDRGDGVVELRDDVVRRDDGVSDRARRHAGRTGQPHLGDTAATGHQQRVGVSVIAAVEFHDLVAARGASCNRTALMTASVPDETSRTCSSPSTRWVMTSASSTSPGVGAPNVVPLLTASRSTLTTRGGRGRAGRRVGLDEVDVALAFRRPRRRRRSHGPPCRACRPRSERIEPASQRRPV